MNINIEADFEFDFEDVFDSSSETTNETTNETTKSKASQRSDSEDFIPSHATILSEWTLIGGGAFGDIYAPNIPSPHYVVKKPKQGSSSIKEMSKREYDILCMLITNPHPHIIRFIQGGYEEDDIQFFTHTYFCFEYAALGDLCTYLEKEYINKSKYLSPYFLNELLLGIAMGLSHLHEHCKVLHRDLKPENILLSYRHGKIISLIGDFGLSIQLSSPSDIVKTTQAVGSMHYVAPESYFQKEYSVKSDIYSFAVLTYAMAVLSTPFYSIFETNRDEAFDRINKEQRAKTPEGLVENAHRQMIHDCWAPNPKDRPYAEQIVLFQQEMKHSGLLSHDYAVNSTQSKMRYEKWSGRYGIFDRFERRPIASEEAMNPQDDVETHNALGF